MKCAYNKKNSFFERNHLAKAMLLLSLGSSSVYASDMTLTQMQQTLQDQQKQLSEQMSLINELKKEQSGKSGNKSSSEDWSFDVFGDLDMGLYFQNKSAGPSLTNSPSDSSLFQFMGNAEGMSNLGVRGKYQMSPGWSVGIEARGGVSYSDTSTSYNPFNRALNVQFGTPHGTFIIGRQLDPAWFATVRSDPHRAKQTYDALAAAWSFGQGTGSPQTGFYPTGALGYKNRVGSVNVGLLYKPGSEPSSADLMGKHQAGQQVSMGLTYDNRDWFASAAYVEKHGTTSSINDVDVRNWTLGIGKHLGSVFLQTGVSSVYLPHGVTGSPLGLSSKAWTNMSNEQHIMVSYAGGQWNWNDMNTIDLTYYYAYDKLNTDNNTKMLVLGNDYKVNKYLTFYVSGAVAKSGADANPLTAALSPSTVAKQDATTLSSTVGVRVTF